MKLRFHILLIRRQQYIGAVKFGRFESSDKSLPRRFFVATEQNVLASLNFVTGDLSKIINCKIKSG